MENQRIQELERQLELQKNLNMSLLRLGFHMQRHALHEARTGDGEAFHDYAVELPMLMKERLEAFQAQGLETAEAVDVMLDMEGWKVT